MRHLPATDSLLSILKCLVAGSVLGIIVILIFFTVQWPPFWKESGLTRVTSNKLDQYNPSIYGNLISYINTDEDGAEIFLYNIMNGERMEVTDDYYNQYVNDIWDGYIVCGDARGGNSNILLYDLIEGRKVLIDGGDEHRMFPSIGDDFIAWPEFDGDSYQIMIYNISRCVKVSNFARSV